MDIENNNYIVNKRSYSIGSLGSACSFGSIETISLDSICSNKERTSSYSDEVIYTNSTTIPIKITNCKMTNELLNNDASRRNRDIYLTEDTLQTSKYTKKLCNKENVITHSPNPSKWYDIIAENYVTCMQIKNKNNSNNNNSNNNNNNNSNNSKK